MDKQPDVLILASLLEESDRHWNKGIAQELRRLHTLNQELADALSMVLDDPQALDGRPRTYEYVCAALAKHKEQA